MRQKVLIKNLRKWWRPDKEKKIQVVNNGGWHFNNLFSPKEISIKLKTFAHQEFANEKFSNENVIRKKISQLQDLFDRGQKYKVVSLNNTFPEFIQKNYKLIKFFLAQNRPHEINNKFSFKYKKYYIFFPRKIFIIITLNTWE